MTRQRFIFVGGKDGFIIIKNRQVNELASSHSEMKIFPSQPSKQPPLVCPTPTVGRREWVCARVISVSPRLLLFRLKYTHSFCIHECQNVCRWNETIIKFKWLDYVFIVVYRNKFVLNLSNVFASSLYLRQLLQSTFKI